MGAVRERHPLAGPGVIGVERRAGIARDPRDIEERDTPVGAGHDKGAVVEADVGLGGFERLGGDAGALLDDDVGGAPDRGAAHIGRARAAVPAADRDQVGVALHEADALVRHAEPLGEDLRERRLVPLADRLGAGDQRHGAVRLEADIDILRRRAAGRLDVIGEAEPAQPAARLAVAAPRGEAGDVGGGERAVERLGKGAAVDAVAERVGRRHRRRRHQVATAQFGAVDAGLLGGAVDQPLDDVDHLGIAGTAQHAIGAVLVKTPAT